MINLHFSKRNNPCIMKSANEWTINGKVTYERVSKNGLWLTVKSNAKHSDLFTSDKMSFDCFIPLRLTEDKNYSKLHAKGRFEFFNNEMFFIVSEIL